MPHLSGQAPVKILDPQARVSPLAGHTPHAVTCCCWESSVYITPGRGWMELVPFSWTWPHARLFLLPFLVCAFHCNKF